MDSFEEYLSQFPAMADVKTGVQYSLESTTKKYWHVDWDFECQAPKTAIIQQHMRLE